MLVRTIECFLTRTITTSSPRCVWHFYWGALIKSFYIQPCWGQMSRSASFEPGLFIDFRVTFHQHPHGRTDNVNVSLITKYSRYRWTAGRQVKMPTFSYNLQHGRGKRLSFSFSMPRFEILCRSLNARKAFGRLLKLYHKMCFGSAKCEKWLSRLRGAVTLIKQRQISDHCKYVGNDFY